VNLTKASLSKRFVSYHLFFKHYVKALCLQREITPGMRNTDRFLASEKPLHSLLTLLSSQHFYVRYFSLQLLGTLLSTRPEPVQKQVLTAPGGLGSLVDVLDDKREIIRNGKVAFSYLHASPNSPFPPLQKGYCS